MKYVRNCMYTSQGDYICKPNDFEGIQQSVEKSIIGKACYLNKVFLPGEDCKNGLGLSLDKIKDKCPEAQTCIYTPPPEQQLPQQQLPQQQLPQQQSRPSILTSICPSHLKTYIDEVHSQMPKNYDERPPTYQNIFQSCPNPPQKI